MSVASVLTQTLTGSGNYCVIPYSSELFEKIAKNIIWSGSDKYGFLREVRFEDLIWKPIGEKIGTAFEEIPTQFEYELKILTLAIYTNGVGEGMPPLKWSTTVCGIRKLKYLATLFSSMGLKSFSDLATMNPLKLRNIFLKIVEISELKNKPSFTASMKTSIRWLWHYGFISIRETEIFDELTLTTINQYKKNGAIQHSIIPTRIMKALIFSVTSEIERIKPSINAWKRLQLAEIANINKGRYSLKSGRYLSASGGQLSGYGDLIKDVRLLPPLVSTLVLAFTGMRNGEAFSLKNDCLTIREQNGERMYFLTTELTKTTDGFQKLEWISSESTAVAIEILVEINSLVHRKAQAILGTLGSKISSEYRNELIQGIKENSLFSASFSLKNCRFFRRSKRPVSSAFNITDYFQITVGDLDIEQLDRLGCNYKSLSPNSKKRGIKYSAGDIFNFTPHQFRHTFAWFIIANRLGELDDIRYQYKHLWQSMTLIYSQRGFESIGELINIADDFAKELTQLTVKELVQYSEEGRVAGKGGEKFSRRIQEILGSQYTSSMQPHFKDMSQLIEFVAVNSNSLRGVSHGYCTKNLDCKIKNIADPSHCVYCDGYIATPKHLPHWKAIKESCTSKLSKLENAPTNMRVKLEAMKTILTTNIRAANVIIDQLENSRAKINE